MRLLGRAISLGDRFVRCAITRCGWGRVAIPVRGIAIAAIVGVGAVRAVAVDIGAASRFVTKLDGEINGIGIAG